MTGYESELAGTGASALMVGGLVANQFALVMTAIGLVMMGAVMIE